MIRSNGRCCPCFLRLNSFACFPPFPGPNPCSLSHWSTSDCFWFWSHKVQGMQDAHRVNRKQYKGTEGQGDFVISEWLESLNQAWIEKIYLLHSPTELSMSPTYSHWITSSATRITPATYEKEGEEQEERMERARSKQQHQPILPPPFTKDGW